MKHKGLIAAFAFAFLLSGCSDKYTSVSDKNAVVMSVGDVQVTKNELYRFLLANDGFNQTMEAMMGHITAANIEVTEELESEAKEQLNSMKEMLGDEFASFIKGYGYQTEDEYYEQVILYNIKNTKLIAKYVETKFDQLALTHKPRKVQIIEIKDQAKAKEAHDKLSANETFEAVGKEYGTVYYSGKQEVLIANSGLDAAVAAIIQNTTTATRINEIITGSNGNYYIVNVVEGDPEKFKEEALEALAGVAAISDEATRFYLKEAGFKIHDKLVFDQFKQTAPDLIFD